ncbi:lytic transglycosylase domain-containing protein [Methylolobus aquaticus]
MRRLTSVLCLSAMLSTLGLAGCSSPTPPRQQRHTVAAPETAQSPPLREPVAGFHQSGDDDFPRPAELEPQIDFWRHVYGTWSRSQVAIHDDRYLGVVYELIDLPGPITEGYNAQQKELVRERKDYWQQRMRDLEEAWVQNRNLGVPDKAILSRLEGAAARPDAILGAADRVRAQRGLRERFKRGLEISARYDQTFRRIFRDAGLPEDLAYLPHVESSFQAHAKSSAGAVGIWQFTRSAAERFMTMNGVVDERLDPVASARGAARYLRYALGKLSVWPLALTSYNHGIAGMQRARESVGEDFVRIVRHYDHPKFGFASRNFYAEFLAARDIARHPQQFFPEGLQVESPLDWERVVLASDLPLSEVARRYGVDRDRLISMNAAWSDSVTSETVPVPAGTEVWLPPGMGAMSGIGAGADHAEAAANRSFGTHPAAAME